MKQRLIDAHKAKIILWGYSRFSGIDEAPYEYAEEAIDILPTIEAIPIEWIVKWAWAFMDKSSEGYKMAMELLHDWEKENETN